jgi:hypothetical protein
VGSGLLSLRALVTAVDDMRVCVEAWMSVHRCGLGHMCVGKARGESRDITVDGPRL